MDLSLFQCSFPKSDGHLLAFGDFAKSEAVRRAASGRTDLMHSVMA